VTKIALSCGEARGRNDDVRRALIGRRRPETRVKMDAKGWISQPRDTSFATATSKVVRFFFRWENSPSICGI